MAVEQDYPALVDASIHVPRPIQNVIMLSPNDEQYRLIREEFTGSTIYSLKKASWDLNNPTDDTADLIVACNVFHYSKNPTLWFQHVFAACKFFLIQDLISRKRNGNNELGDDGDATRYDWRSSSQKNHPVFDLVVFEDRLLHFQAYDAGSRDGNHMVNFAAVFKGDLL